MEHLYRELYSYSIEHAITQLHLGNHFYYWAANTAPEGINKASKRLNEAP